MIIDYNHFHYLPVRVTAHATTNIGTVLRMPPKSVPTSELFLRHSELDELIGGFLPGCTRCL
jgi:hypothetical protein